ncbi:hypothetical protein OG596_37730 [Streptomyces sp. NBC_01102]|uniref:hypothetical protein n=1 Tax=Streptomyces sp. NBC_01102 TaxID=2903749 RepID=UPI003868BA0B|nr:hypothetical protein OG596_00190 [Streptomyces sp. NBC_01102]WSU70699.1 hypothetical protein OG596_37730 [Streptomyces sp. NBC_01102]
MIDRWDQEDDARRIRSRPRTIGEYFAAEQPLLVPLPKEPFETGRLSTPRVDRYSRICVRTKPLLGAGPPDRADRPRHASRLRAGGLRRTRQGKTVALQYALSQLPHPARVRRVHVGVHPTVPELRRVLADGRS